MTPNQKKLTTIQLPGEYLNGTCVMDAQTVRDHLATADRLVRLATQQGPRR